MFLGELGKGTFGRVVKVRCNSESSDDDSEKALKIEKPACLWEWYIYKEIEFRLKDSKKVSNCINYYNIFVLIIYFISRQLCYFINMDKMHVFKNGSIISMEFSKYGTLLSAVLAFKKTYVSYIYINNFCVVL